MNRKIVFAGIFVVLSLYSLVAGMICGIASLDNAAIEPEYISALLTGSSIVFGFWVTLYSINGRSKRRKDFPFRSATLGLLIVLSLSVFFVLLSAAKIIHASLALASLCGSFLNNICIIFLYFVAEPE